MRYRIIWVVAVLLLCSSSQLFALEREYSNISYLNIRSKFIRPGSRLTDIQQEEAWKTFTGRWIRWTGTVRDVSVNWGALTISVDMGAGSVGSDILLYPTDASIEAARKLPRGQRIFFAGHLDGRPGGFLPMILRDVELLRPEKLDVFYPIIFSRPQEIIGIVSSAVCRRIERAGSAKSRVVSIIRQALAMDKAGMIHEGAVAGHFSQAHILDRGMLFWISNSHIRNAGIPVVDSGNAR
ncbi:MAG: hypothetical protein WBG50_07655 [Desulfomonilaceae bacterium]